MDPKKKRLYIILIISCFAMSAAILLWSNFSGTGAEGLLEPPIVTNSGGANSLPGASVGVRGDAIKGYSAPSVFPLNRKFKSDVLTSEEFLLLQPYSLLDITGQLGRPDPFANY